jgi:hypothetical protein
MEICRRRERNQKCEKLIPSKKIHVGFHLKMNLLRARKFPLTLTKGEVGYDQGKDDPWDDSPYEDYRSLYEWTYEETPEYYEEVEFEAENRGNLEIKYRESPADMKLTIHKSEWICDGVKEINLAGIARWSD